MELSPRLKAKLLAIVTGGPFGANKVNRPVLYAVYGNDIIARLARIYQHPGRDGPDGMLVVALHGRSPAYIRCAFTANGETLECEAVIGHYPQAGTPVAAKPAIEQALHDSGYWRDDATGRFLFPYDLGPRPGYDEWGGVSVTILKPLIDVFGARTGSKIDIIAPLAPHRDEAAILRQMRGENE